MATSTSTTTTTTTTMRPSQRVLLEAFPAPPSHIPNPPGPPPSGPPTLPLPPVPGPSRVSVDEQLLFLSSVANRSHRSSKYSVASSHRDSVLSIGSSTSRRASVVSGESPRSPTFFIRPSISVSSARLAPADQLTRPMLLSDIEDDESEPIPARMPSPFLDSSWRRSKHHHNESISSIDVRAILGDATDEEIHPHSAPPTSFSHLHSLPLPMHTSLSLSSSSNSPSSPLASSDTSLSDTPSAQHDPHFSPSRTVKDLRLERRAERTKSPGLKRVFAVRSRSRSRLQPSLGDTTPPIPKPTELPVFDSDLSTGNDDMTLDELGPLPEHPLPPSSLIAFPSQLSPQQTETPRTPSPDIESILSETPRPALRKAASQSRLRSQAIIRPRIDSTSNTEYRRRASEGVLREARSNPSWHGHDASFVPRNRTLSHGMPVGGDGEDKTGDGDESDSSIDLHTPLPHLMVRDGLLSSNSRLLPTSTRRRDGRSDSVMTTGTTFTKTGIMKDERDTPMRRVRHRDNRLLKGGIGLTTGLGWSDSEDEDAPSPLTRRLSTLNLSRRSSASSVRTTSSISHHRHPLSRSYSSGALIESLEEDADEQTTVVVPPVSRPRVPSAGRLSKPGLPPTSWIHKSAATQLNGTRTSTSSVGSTFSIDTTLSEGVPRRPSKLGRPSSGFRDSSGSSENYDRSSLRRKGSPGNDRTSSSTTASTLSTGIPSTPRDYDPSMSSPAGFGSLKSYNREKSLPPLPNSLLRKRPSNHNLSNFNFPRVRTFSSTSSSVPSPTSPSPTSSASPVRPLHLPRQAARVDRAAVPVPSVLSSSSSSPSQSSLRQPVPRSPPPDETVPASAVRPRPRTGTGMMYRTSSGSRLRAPMTLASSTSPLERNSGLSVVGSLGRTKVPRIPPV